MKNLLPDKLLYIDLEITNACPADCPMCPRDKLPSTGIMSEQVFAGVLDFFNSSTENLCICICGIGEPLLHPKLFDYIRMLRQLDPKHHILIVTSGERLTPQVFETLKSIGTDSINLSLQAIDEQLYNKLMPGLKLEKVLKNIDYISKNQSTDLNFTINLTVNKINEPNVKDIMEFVKSKNLDIEVNKVHSRGGNMLDPSIIDSPALNTNPVTSCSIFETVTFISWTGDIYPCAQDIERINKIGNVNDDTMNDINLRKKGLLANGLKYKICSLCTDKIRLGTLSEKKTDSGQRISSELCKKLGIFGENYLSKLIIYKTPDELLTHIDLILSDISRTINILSYLRKKYTNLSLDIYPLDENQIIDEKILASMNLDRENLTQTQLDNIYSYLINKYGLFLENIFNSILLMPRQQIISMVYKHFTDVRQFLIKDLNLMYLWKEKMVKKQIVIRESKIVIRNS